MTQKPGMVFEDAAERRELATSRAGLFGAIGIAALVVAVIVSRFVDDGWRRLCFAYVANYAFFLSLSLGGLFFVLLQHVTRAGWSVVVRRPAEVLAMNSVLMAILFIPIAVMVASGSGDVYPWAQPVPAGLQAGEAGEHVTATDGEHHAGAAEVTAHEEHAGEDVAHAAQPAHHGLDELTLGKRPYLNRPFFFVRWIVYFIAWIGLSRYFWRRSVAQDATGDQQVTLRLQAVSAPALVVYALTLTFASFDLLMSLDPHWFSTIFGVYYFSGAFVGFLAALIIALMALQRQGLLTRSITVEHFHDLGKLLFAFVFFWGYIAFSQYMLIWYGNIPEETTWLLHRGASTGDPNVWSAILVILLLGHFIIPFGGLLSRHVKRSRSALLFWAVWMLVMHWIDVAWLTLPEFTTDYLPVGVLEIACLVGLGGLYVAGFYVNAYGRSLIPTRDPRLPESLGFENV